MNFNGAWLIAMAIAFAGMYVGDAIKSLRAINVEMQTKVRIVDQDDRHGPR